MNKMQQEDGIPSSENKADSGVDGLVLTVMN